jgi:hypothetical protein
VLIEESFQLIEFVNVKIGINRYKYSYHYQDATEQLIFRYDMAPHFLAEELEKYQFEASTQQAIQSQSVQHLLQQVAKKYQVNHTVS